jgi:hypothetical protein
VDGGAGSLDDGAAPAHGGGGGGGGGGNVLEQANGQTLWINTNMQQHKHHATTQTPCNNTNTLQQHKHMQQLANVLANTYTADTPSKSLNRRS